MGMYTDLIFGATLKEKTPTYVTQALDCVINDTVVNLSDEAKEYRLMYANYKKEYLDKYGDNKR